MKLVIGLGNPGIKYVGTRHNVGFLLIDKLKNSPKMVAKKSDEYMNSSGIFVKKLIDNLRLRSLSDLYVVHDDLDIKLGKYKIQKGRGPKDHKGLLSIYDALGTSDFWHVRIGIENRSPENRLPGEDYVLKPFTQEETRTINSLLPKAAKDINDR